MNYPKTLQCVIMPALILALTGCFESARKPAPRQAASPVRFKFPEGWSELSEQEWREMDLGENRTQVTVMDGERLAGFSVIRVPLDGLTPAISVDSIHAAGPGKYENYRLIKKGKAQFAGRSVGEIVYQGQNPGKELRWYRVLIAAPPDRTDRLLMLLHSTPLGREGEFAADFASIEQSWQWQD
jgi:hypothetical protein